MRGTPRTCALAWARERGKHWGLRVAPAEAWACSDTYQEGGATGVRAGWQRFAHGGMEAYNTLHTLRQCGLRYMAKQQLRSSATCPSAAQHLPQRAQRRSRRRRPGQRQTRLRDSGARVARGQRILKNSMQPGRVRIHHDSQARAVATFWGHWLQALTRPWATACTRGSHAGGSTFSFCTCQHPAATTRF